MSTQSGSIHIYRFVHVGTAVLEDLFHIPDAHEMYGESMPVWIVAFDRFDSNYISSGGDDGRLRLWDLHQQLESKLGDADIDTVGATDTIDTIDINFENDDHDDYNIDDHDPVVAPIPVYTSASSVYSAGVTTAQWHPKVR